jgi:NAD(P)H dehydrogenase (quinone)
VEAFKHLGHLNVIHRKHVSMKIAVTAASGQLGGAIVRQLIQEIGAEHIIGTARNPSKAQQLGISIKQGDYNSRTDFEKALQGIDVVMVVSGMDAPEKRIGQHRNIIQAAKDAGVRKIVYSSIVSHEGKSSFDNIVQSNRQTEKDVRDSGIQWAIGRNGLYIEPDVEYISTYKQEGKVANCAGEGLCSYTTRPELAYAYSQLILKNDRNGRIFNLTGEAITQQTLTEYLNLAFGTNLVYEEMSPEAYLTFQQKVNGEFLGKIVAGIYTKIRQGEFNIKSDYEAAAGRRHLDWQSYFSSLKNQ